MRITQVERESLNGLRRIGATFLENRLWMLGPIIAEMDIVGEVRVRLRTAQQ